MFYPKFWQRRNLVSGFFQIFTPLYAALSLSRKLLVKPIDPCGTRLICVGNVTVGGTGKTQAVLWLGKFLKNHNRRFIVISKAYGASLRGAMLVSPTTDPALAGDEAVMLSSYVPVISASKFKYGFELALSMDKVNPCYDPEVSQIIIVDDGLQNPAIKADLNILIVDALRGFGNGLLIPAGPMRESISSVLSKTNVIISVKVDPLGISTISELEASSKPILEALIEPVRFLEKQGKYFAFSGIGNPERFIASLNRAGVDLVGYQNFGDHHAYNMFQLRRLFDKANSLNAKLITTSKDYVKVKHLVSVEEFEVELKITNSIKLEELIYERIFQKN
jgi:tetraacyldisaccharide 4'-kinase